VFKTVGSSLVAINPVVCHLFNITSQLLSEILLIFEEFKF